jgi:hypothetical protein
MEKLKNDQCTGCAHAAMCKYISAYDREINALNEHISDYRQLLDELPKGFRISVYCDLFLPARSGTVKR